MNNEVKLIITANNTGAVTGIKGITDSLAGMSIKAQSLTAMFRAHWLEFSALTAGVYFSVKKIYNEFAAAAEREEKRLAFTNLAASFGANADSIVADLKRMSGQSVTSFEIMQRAGKAMLSGLDPKALPGLMEFSKTVTKITGERTVDVFDDLSRAIITGQDRMLRLHGITVDFDKAQKDLAESLGGAKEQLNAQQIQYANLTELLRAATEMTQRMGADTQTMSDKVEATSAEIVESFTRIKDAAYQAFGTPALLMLKEFARELEQTNYLINFGKAAYQRVKGLFSSGVSASVGANGSSPEDFQPNLKGVTSVKDLKFSFEEELGPGLQSLKEYTDELKTSLGEIAKSEKDLTKETSQQIRDREQVYHNMYEALKFDTEKYYTYQKGLLEKQLNEEIAITGDLTLAWEAYYARLQALEEERMLRTDDFAGGIKVYYQELSREGFTWAEGAKGMMEDVASSGTNSLARLAKNAETDFSNLGSHIKTFAREMIDSWLDAVNQMIAKWLMFKIITGIGGFFLGGGMGGLSGVSADTASSAGGWMGGDEGVMGARRTNSGRRIPGISGTIGSGSQTQYNITIQNSFLDATGVEKYESRQKRQIESVIKNLRRENKLR